MRDREGMAGFEMTIDIGLADYRAKRVQKSCHESCIGLDYITQLFLFFWEASIHMV